MVGEVRITLEDIMRTKRRASVISKYFDGVFDQVREEPERKPSKGRRRGSATPAKCASLLGNVEAESSSQPS